MSKSKTYTVELNSKELERIHSFLVAHSIELDEILQEDEAEHDIEEIENDKKRLYETSHLLKKISEIEKGGNNKKRDTTIMIFADDKHEQLFNDLCTKMKYLDNYHTAAAYILSLDKVCREHIEDIFDLKEDVIKPEGLCKAWQTSTSRKSCRLLFNLWNGYNSEGEALEEEQPSANYTPENIFSCSYAPFYWQAIKLRYPDYTEEQD